MLLYDDCDTFIVMQNNTPLSVPTVTTAPDSTSWRCARCGEICDPSLSLWIRPGTSGKRAKVWHAACPPQSKVKGALLAIVAAIAIVGCGGAAPAEDLVGTEMHQPAPTSTTAPTPAAPAEDLVGTWVNICSDTTTTIEITATTITIVVHVDGQADQFLVGGYSTTPAGHLVLDQDGAQLDLGGYAFIGGALAIDGAFAGVYHRAAL